MIVGCFVTPTGPALMINTSVFHPIILENAVGQVEGYVNRGGCSARVAPAHLALATLARPCTPRAQSPGAIRTAEAGL